MGLPGAAYFFAGFFGAIAAIFALLYVVLRDARLLLAVAFMGALLALELNRLLNFHVDNALLLSLYLIALVAFSRTFLDTGTSLRLFDRIVLGAAALTILSLFMRLAPGLSSVAAIVNRILFDLTLIALLAISTASYYAGRRLARFLVIAFAGGCIGALMHLGWSFEAGAAWQGAALCLAVAAAMQKHTHDHALELAGAAQLETLATIDGVTGIANRRSFDARFQSEWNRACRSGRNLAVAFIDVDFFKGYNDTHGPQAGDDVLRQIAKTIARYSMRASELCARYSGEVFVLVLPEAQELQVKTLGEQIRKSVVDLRIEYPPSPHDVITVSLGIATTVPLLNENPDALLEAAMSALAEAKARGRNVVIV
ncbi:MAG: hypothetical protein NVSMB31_12530 [Vulcanimicrobiaceae bacterium]